MENLTATATVATIDGGLTDKGNLKRAVQSAIKDQGAAKFLTDFELTPKGDYVVHVANVDGKPVYLKVNMTVSIAENLFDAPKATGSASKEDEVEIGNIFGQ